MRDRPEVEQTERTEIGTPEVGVKGFETLVGFLTAEVTLPNLKGFVS